MEFPSKTDIFTHKYFLDSQNDRARRNLGFLCFCQFIIFLTFCEVEALKKSPAEQFIIVKNITECQQ